MPLFSGLILGLASPQVDGHPLVWIGLVPLWIFILKTTSSREAGIGAFLGGFFFHIIQLSWMPVLLPWGGAWIYLGWILLAFYVALYFGVWGYFSRRLVTQNPVLHALTGAALFTLLEWIRTLGMFGVPVGQLNTMAIPILPFARLAEWMGGFGLTFLIVLVNILIALAIVRRLFLPLGILMGCLLVAIYAVNTTPISSPHELRIALIQPNIPQEIKMDADAAENVFAKILEMSEESIHQNGPVDLMVWPETAVLTYITHDPKYLQPLQNFTRKHQLSLIFGTPEYRRNGDDYEIFNSAIHLNWSGEIIGRYDKMQLVPFGEFLPFRPALYPIFRNFTFFQKDYTRGEKPVRFQIGEVEAIPAICFESMMGHAMRKRRGEKPAFFLVMTNDAWFGKTGIVKEHFRHGQLRAIESGIPLVQVGNSGYSGYISANGEVKAVSRLMEESIQTIEIEIPSGR